MSRICTKCKNSIPDTEQLSIVAEKYPTCNKCWAEWKEYQIMVMNEMKLDMSMPEEVIPADLYLVFLLFFSYFFELI